MSNRARNIFARAALDPSALRALAPSTGAQRVLLQSKMRMVSAPKVMTDPAPTPAPAPAPAHSMSLGVCAAPDGCRSPAGSAYQVHVPTGTTVLVSGYVTEGGVLQALASYLDGTVTPPVVRSGLVPAADLQNLTLVALPTIPDLSATAPAPAASSTPATPTGASTGQLSLRRRSSGPIGPQPARTSEQILTLVRNAIAERRSGAIIRALHAQYQAQALAEGKAINSLRDLGYFGVDANSPITIDESPGDQVFDYGVLVAQTYSGTVGDVAVPNPVPGRVVRMTAREAGNVRGAPDVRARVVMPYAAGTVAISPHIDDLRNAPSAQAPNGWVAVTSPAVGWVAIHKFVNAEFIYGASTGQIQLRRRAADVLTAEKRFDPPIEFEGAIKGVICESLPGLTDLQRAWIQAEKQRTGRTVVNCDPIPAELFASDAQRAFVQAQKQQRAIDENMFGVIGLFIAPGGAPAGSEAERIYKLWAASVAENRSAAIQNSLRAQYENAMSALGLAPWPSGPPGSPSRLASQGPISRLRRAPTGQARCNAAGCSLFYPDRPTGQGVYPNSPIQFPAGTIVTTYRSVDGYTRVRAADGQFGWIATGELTPFGGGGAHPELDENIFGLVGLPGTSTGQIQLRRRGGPSPDAIPATTTSQAVERIERAVREGQHDNARAHYAAYLRLAQRERLTPHPLARFYELAGVALPDFLRSPQGVIVDCYREQQGAFGSQGGLVVNRVVFAPDALDNPNRRPYRRLPNGAVVELFETRHGTIQAYNDVDPLFDTRRSMPYTDLWTHVRWTAPDRGVVEGWVLAHCIRPAPAR